MNLDQSLAFTALLEMWPGYRRMRSQEAWPIQRDLAAAMTEADPKDRWEFARQWIEERQS